jgi:RHS repeat-associated protein
VAQDRRARNDLDRTATATTRWAGRTLSYDLNGNLSGDGVNQYAWNEQGLLSQISGGVTASFSYDVFGRRNDRTVNGHRMQTAWIGDEPNLMVPDGDWSRRIRVFSPYPDIGLDELTFRRIGDDASQDRYVLRDANSNVIALTDAGQQSQTQYSYEPYGGTTQAGVADPNTQQYTGRENDGTGLYYYRNRYYSPQTGRFISEDPIGWASGQTNAYAYVGGNPVQFTDPLGCRPFRFPCPRHRLGRVAVPVREVFRNGSAIWSTELRRSNRRRMLTIRTGQKRLVNRQRLMDFKTQRAVKIGCLIQIQEEEVPHGDGKMQMGMFGLRLDRVAGRTRSTLGHTRTWRYVWE